MGPLAGTECHQYQTETWPWSWVELITPAPQSVSLASLAPKLSMGLAGLVHGPIIYVVDLPLQKGPYVPFCNFPTCIREREVIPFFSNNLMSPKMGSHPMSRRSRSLVAYTIFGRQHLTKVNQILKLCHLCTPSLLPFNWVAGLAPIAKHYATTSVSPPLRLGGWREGGGAE